MWIELFPHDLHFEKELSCETLIRPRFHEVEAGFTGVRVVELDQAAVKKKKILRGHVRGECFQPTATGLLVLSVPAGMASDNAAHEFELILKRPGGEDSLENTVEKLFPCSIQEARLDLLF